MINLHASLNRFINRGHVGDMAQKNILCGAGDIRHLKIDVYVKRQTASEVFDFTTLLY